METINLNFVCSYYDDRASLNRDLLLTYYIQCQVKSDINSIRLQDLKEIKDNKKKYFVSLFDRKNKRIYLKKTEINLALLSINQLYLQNIVTIYSRKLCILSFADRQTEIFLKEDLTLRNIQIIAPKLCEDLASAISTFEKVDYRISQMSLITAGKIMVVMKGYCEKTNNILTKVKTCYSDLEINHISEVEKGSDDIVAMSEIELEKRHNIQSASLLIVLPHVIIHGNVGAILSSLVKSMKQHKLTLELLKTQVYTIESSKAIFELYKGVWLDGFYHNKSCHLSSGLSISLAISSAESSCVKLIREICGPINITVAQKLRPLTLRSKFGVDKIKCGVHCTDLVSDGLSDINLVFDILTRA